jgi:hypothetical protein
MTTTPPIVTDEDYGFAIIGTDAWFKIAPPAPMEENQFVDVAVTFAFRGSGFDSVEDILHMSSIKTSLRQYEDNVVVYEEFEPRTDTTTPLNSRRLQCGEETANVIAPHLPDWTALTFTIPVCITTPGAHTLSFTLYLGTTSIITVKENVNVQVKEPLGG